MSKVIRLLSFLTLLTGMVTTAIGAANDFPDTVGAGSINLQLNGQGVRKKLLISLYHAGLYLVQKSSDGPAIISADEPMGLLLVITSGLITSDKMEKAARAGFEKSTNGNLDRISGEIESFISVFREPIVKGDRYQMVYLPDDGVAVGKNGQHKTTISGLEFKKALFGIWLAKSPAQKSLKKAMLGGG